MSKTKEQAAERAERDLAARLGIDAAKITLESIDEAEFPNGSLGAPVDGEMSMMMITPGWKLQFSAEGKTYEYRAANGQLRLFRFDGQNFVVE
ncbi:MAG: hypothetical protein UZ17_ACD001002809 [Acidobacteria bacterium OLB17]|nr:MAG: hypothetical protein UZ17_ACD001002809 [Acidobacteria bacterium OLB17]MCZ2391166.1 hypothetical protein [Acidobacteriota bacterium]